MFIAYAARLREKSKDCEFEEQTEDRILEHFIQTIKDNELVKRHIQKKWVLDRFLEKASQREDIDQQVKDMKEYFGISKVEHQSKDLPVGWKNKIEDTTVTSQKTRRQTRERGKQELWLLGKNRNTSPGLKLANHYASCCRVGAPHQDGFKGTERGRIKRTTVTEEISSD